MNCDESSIVQTIRPFFKTFLKSQIACALPCLCLMMVLSPANGATFYVDGRHMSPPFMGTQREPFALIEEALDASVSGDEIRIAVGEYAENLIIQNKSIHLSGGWQGAVAEDYEQGGNGGRFDIRAEEGTWTHISGDPSASVIFFQDEGASGSVIERLHITDGLHGIAMADWPPLTDLVIRDNWIQNNGRPELERGVVDGGGILLSGERLKVLNNVIQGNEAGMGAGLSGNIRHMQVIGNRFLDNNGHSDHGGGVSLSGSGLIKDNLFANNRTGIGWGYGWGGGMTVFGDAQLPAGEIFHLEGNEYRDNFAPTAGGGLFVDDGAIAELRHELVHHNRVDANGNGGAGVYVDGAGTNEDGYPSFALFEFCTIAHNSGRDGNAGNGILVERAEVTVLNCILSGNTDDFSFNGIGKLDVSYTMSEELIAGEGNQTGDPLFADTELPDYHLKSQHGRWNPFAKNWVKDAVHSPGIDAASVDASW